MRVLFEIPSVSSDYHRFQFEWLSKEGNRLFVMQDGKQMKTLGIDSEPIRELQSASLADTRKCTSYSWSKDGNLLALVVDKKLIYFWDVQNNNLVHYKPKLNNTSEQVTRKNRAREVEIVVWSKISNRLAIGYSNGHILICNHDSDLSEIFVDNSDGVLRKIVSIESSKHLDIFFCITEISELLVMTFSGQSITYNQGDTKKIRMIKSSPTFTVTTTDETSKQTSEALWLANCNQNNEVCIVMVNLEHRHRILDTSSKDKLIFKLDNEEQVVDFFWLSSDFLLVCHTSGDISLVQIRKSKASKFSLNSTKIFNLRANDGQKSTNNSTYKASPGADVYKSYRLLSHGARDIDAGSENRTGTKPSNNNDNSFSFAAMSEYKLFYYELLKVDDEPRYVLEKVDDIDLSKSLEKLDMKLERLEWSLDGSMIAVQLTNGHILIYQTRLNYQMIASYSSKTAYLSGTNEVTILNYELDSESLSATDEAKDDTTETTCSIESKALIVMVDLKPSVLAIGPKHLAIGLNNRVRFYLLETIDNAAQTGPILEEEYMSIVASIALSSNYVAILFEDHRLKLHAIRCSVDHNNLNNTDDHVNERFFPDPMKPNRISAFTLTDCGLIYCTESCSLMVFSFKDWCHVQANNHRKQTQGLLINKLIMNSKGNKCICLSIAGTSRAFLYDCNRNVLSSFRGGSKLYSNIFLSQLKIVPTLDDHLYIKSIPYKNNFEEQCANLSLVTDAIWDTDGRSVLLIEKKRIHLFIILDHTLEKEESIIELVATIDKPSTYTTLYASHGVISFQTSLGRVINMIAGSHDDENKLTRLNEQIQEIVSKVSVEINGKEMVLAQAEVMRLKLEYFRLVALIYPLSKCAEICEYLMTEEQFNLSEDIRLSQIDDILWRQLAAWSLFTSNLNFALIVYKRRNLQVFVRVLKEIISDLSSRGYDSKSSLITRLLILCDCHEDGDE